MVLLTGETEGDLGGGGDDAWSAAAHACMLGASSNLRLTAAIAPMGTPSTTAAGSVTGIC